MQFCRFNVDRLGVVQGDEICDVTDALDTLPDVKWVRSLHDPFVAALDQISAKAQPLLASAPRLRRGDVTLEAPVALPSKIIGAPVNYHAHLDEAQDDHGLHQGAKVHPIDEIGCFLKAGSALVGDRATITLPKDAARVDHEAEVAVIIGKAGRNIAASDAMAYVAGYSLALDMTVRGKQDRSMRKSCDGFAVLGPTLATPDEVADPARIAFSLSVNGEVRQASDTSLLIRSIPELIEMCSAFYSLLPGDVIMTGTPAGVGPVAVGDTIVVTSPELGVLTAHVT